MVSAPTVIIVGAGGSIPFGFPSGFTLKQEIIGHLQSPGSRIFDALGQLGFGDVQLKSFARELQISGGDSIDTFLEGRNELMLRLGKAAIAAALIPHEQSDFIFSRPPEVNWYRYLFKQLSENINNGAEGPLTILTFNYDRSLDYFLYTSFSKSHTLADTATRQATKNLRIIHLHGMLGHLPIVAPANEPTRAFNTDFGTRSIEAGARDIRVVHEAAKDDPEFVEARRLLSEAARIVALGFGYSSENVKRLLYGNWLHLKNPRVLAFGSAFETTPAERLKIIRGFQDKIQLDNNGFDCCRFLRERLELIS